LELKIGTQENARWFVIIRREFLGGVVAIREGIRISTDGFEKKKKA
jgi:hypothetical protein